MEVPDKVKSVIHRAVEHQKELEGAVDEPGIELVVDNSAIIIANLEADITEIAHNLHTTRDRVLNWSKDVGDALTLMDETLAELETMKARMGIAKAHLEVAQNIPAEQDRSGYIDAALEMLKDIQLKPLRR